MYSSGKEEVPFVTSHQTEVCSPPSPYLTLLELVSEEMDALSLLLGFFKLGFKGPLEVLPRSNSVLPDFLNFFFEIFSKLWDKTKTKLNISDKIIVSIRREEKRWKKTKEIG